MTVLVDLALKEFLGSYQNRGNENSESYDERESTKENEIWCAYCGQGWQAEWELVTDAGEMLVCNDHHFVLKEIHAVEREKRIGQEEWIEVPDFKKQDFEDEQLEDLGDWKDLIDHKAYEQRGNTNK